MGVTGTLVCLQGFQVRKERRLEGFGRASGAVGAEDPAPVGDDGLWGAVALDGDVEHREVGIGIMALRSTFCTPLGRPPGLSSSPCSPSSSKRLRTR